MQMAFAYRICLEKSNWNNHWERRKENMAGMKAGSPLNSLTAIKTEEK